MTYGNTRNIQNKKYTNMKNITKIGLFLLCTFLVASCEKNEIEYMAEDVSVTTAQFQIFYMIPISTGSSNYINKIELNGELLSTDASPLKINSYLPTSVGKYYTTQAGASKLTFYKGSDLDLVYDVTVDLPAGKSTVIIHSFDEAPLIIDAEVPYPTYTTDGTGDYTNIRFYNLMYESEGVPTDLTLQYQFQYIVDNETGDRSDWANLGEPVAFGEATSWSRADVNKRIEISSGYGYIYYRLRVIGDDGSDQGNLILKNAYGNMVEYSDYWTGYIGYARHHMFNGYRNDSPSYRARVRQITAL